MRYAFTRASRKDSIPNSPTLHRESVTPQEHKPAEEGCGGRCFDSDAMTDWCSGFVARFTASVGSFRSRQTPAVVADAVAHDVATGLARSARILADRDLAGRSGGVVQKPLQAAAVETGRPQTSASVG